MAYQKYMFDLDFSPPPTRPKAVEQQAMAEQRPDDEPEAPPPPTFTEEDLQVVREAAYEEGHSAGVTEATAGLEAQMTAAIGAIAQGVAALGDAQEKAADENQRVAAQVAMAVLRKVLPAACEQHAFEEVVRTVQECFANVLDEPRIIIRTEPALVDPVREKLEAVALMHGFEGRVVVQADPRLARGDCKVEWNDGGAERDQARLLSDIEDAVSRSLARPVSRDEDGNSGS